MGENRNLNTRIQLTSVLCVLERSWNDLLVEGKCIDG